MSINSDFLSFTVIYTYPCTDCKPCDSIIINLNTANKQQAKAQYSTLFWKNAINLRHIDSLESSVVPDQELRQNLLKQTDG